MRATDVPQMPLDSSIQVFSHALSVFCAGLADPGPVAAALWTDAELGSAVCLDSIVTVVDARNIRRQLAEDRPQGAVNEAQQQIAYADIILLNKVPIKAFMHLLCSAQWCVTSRACSSKAMSYVGDSSCYGKLASIA